MSCCGGNIAKGFAYLATGQNLQLSKDRMAICKTCENFFGGLSCSICGCFVQAKTRVEAESCPVGKWNPKKT